jgi:ATP-dependent DNA helicase PIF1
MNPVSDIDNQEIFIPRINLTPSQNSELHFTLRCRQFPFVLAFALTINKAQGQSVAKVGLDLRIPCFSHGQLYVALSYVTAPGGVRILLPNELPMTTNIVYTDALLIPP